MVTKTYSIKRLCDLGSEAMAVVSSRLSNITFVKGQAIIGEGQRFRGCFIPLTGYAKIYKTNSLGIDAFVAVTGPQDTIGEFAIFNEDRYPITAVAATDITGVFLAAVDYWDLRGKYPHFAHKAAEQLFRRFRQLNDRVAGLAVGDAEARVVDFFQFLGRSYGLPQADGSLVIPFLLDRGDLADATNLKKETVIRILTRYKKEHKILTEKDKFVLMPAFLLAPKVQPKRPKANVRNFD